MIKQITNKQILMVAALMLGVGLAGGYLLAPTSYETETMQKEDKVLFYRNPMNPAITSPVFTQDEMGMDYIPVYADEGQATAPAGTVSINPIVQQNMGVRTTTAKRQTLSRIIRTVGRVTFDEKRVARLHPKYEGWVERMFIDQTGDKVEKEDRKSVV